MNYSETKKILRQMIDEHDAEQAAMADIGMGNSNTTVSVSLDPIDTTQALRDGLSQVLAILDSHGIEIDNRTQLEDLVNG